MIPWNILVVAFEGRGSEATAFRARLLEAWRGSASLNPSCVTRDDLTVEHLRSVEAVILLVAADDEPTAVFQLMPVLDEADVAVLIVLDEAPLADCPYRFGRAMLHGPPSDADILAAKLEALLHRQPEVQNLHEEVSIAHRFHGGLKGEIARIHDELQLAAMVQREFLPRDLPALCGVDFAAFWRPAHYVSGDIYDIVRLDDDHIGVFLADAVGHGVPAALMTMVICRSLTTKIISGSSYRLIEPSEVLGRLNDDMIRRQGRTTRFATAVYALVNCRSRRMRLAGAGHPPPLLFGEDGSCRELTTTGGLLGVFADEQYAQIEVDLAAGDRLLLYSDGFEQAFPNPGAGDYERRLPTARYRDVFAALGAQETPADMIQELGRQLDDQTGSLHQADDLTMLCMRAGALASAPSRQTQAEVTSTSPPAAA
ncbi:MAG: PP2C family protein-serine/threonine phosphatase [Planctomycetes bacterium]|nr:PP2C family protein-serine/threonine phosphatase [Planctomycetota bacterium]